MTTTKTQCTGTSIRLAIGLGAVGSLLLFGAAGVAASPATEPPSDGIYLVHFSDGHTQTWTITSSCGRGCAHIQSSDGWTQDAQFLANGYSSGFGFEVDGPAAARCPDGTKTFWKTGYTFNSVTLTGTQSLAKSPSCAGYGGVGENELPPSVPFTMTKTS